MAYPSTVAVWQAPNASGMPTFLRMAIVSSVFMTRTAKPALDRCLTHSVQQSQLAFLKTWTDVAARAERAGKTGSAAKAWIRVRPLHRDLLGYALRSASLQVAGSCFSSDA